MTDLRFAIVGTGFWARYQLAAWQELAGAECVALCNRHREKAEELAREFGVPAVYDDPQEMLRRERLDFLDIITDVRTHNALVHLAAAHRLPVISQKPMATTLAEAAEMVRACREAHVPFFVHENWRWQTPIRQLKHELQRGTIGKPFRARLHFCSSVRRGHFNDQTCSIARRNPVLHDEPRGLCRHRGQSHGGIHLRVRNALPGPVQ